MKKPTVNILQVHDQSSIDDIMNSKPLDNSEAEEAANEQEEQPAKSQRKRIGSQPKKINYGKNGN